MESKKNKALLEKYLDGKTSLSEEKYLSDYFKSTQIIPENWESYRMFFGYFDHAKTVQFPVSAKRKFIFFKPWMAAAALIAVVLSIQLNTLSEQKPIIKNNAEVELAFQQFKTNMKMVSNQLNRGTEKVAYLNYWNLTSQKILSK
jgi:hypothetical protein